MQFTVGATGPASPETAWHAYSTPVLWSSWAPHMPRVETSTPSLEAGTTGRFALGPLTLGRFVIVDCDAGTRTWAWQIRVLGLRSDGQHAVTADADGCRCHLRMTLPAPLAVAYRPLAWWALRRLAGHGVGPAPVRGE